MKLSEKNLRKIVREEIMKEEKFSDKQIKRFWEKEGTEYLVTNYLDPRNIENSKLRKAAMDAKSAIEKFEKLIERI